MKFKITGRHFEVSGHLSQYAEKKILKLEKFFHKLIDIEIIMYLEKHDHVIEAVINGDGTKIFGTEKSSNMYSAVDLLSKTLEVQVRKHKEKHSGHKASPLKNTDTNNNLPEKQIQILYNQAVARPKDEIEAFLEMKLDNRDFILFNKTVNNDNKNNSYAVIYKLDDGFKLAEIPQKMLKEKNLDAEDLTEFDLIVNNDSPAKPKIKLKKCRNKTIKCSTVDIIANEITASNCEFMPFFNNDTNSFNIIYKNGESIEVMVPPA